MIFHSGLPRSCSPSAYDVIKVFWVIFLNGGLEYSKAVVYPSGAVDYKEKIESSQWV